MSAAFVARFARGATYHARAIAFLSAHPGLRRYLLWPLAINVVAGGLLYAGMLYGGWRLVDWGVALLPAWLAFVAVLLHIVLVLGLLVVTGILVAKFGVLLGAPWYGRLAERIEVLKLGPDRLPTPASGPLGVVADLGSALGYEIKKLLLAAAIGLPLLALNLVPVAGQLAAAAGGALLAMTILCLDFLDPALSRRRLRFRAKLATVFRHMPATGGFGLVALALAGVPLLNLITVPLSVTAGMLLYCDEIAGEATPATA